MYTVADQKFYDFFEAVHYAARIAMNGAEDGIVYDGAEIVAIIRSRK